MSHVYSEIIAIFAYKKSAHPALLTQYPEAFDE